MNIRSHNLTLLRTFLPTSRAGFLSAFQQALKRRFRQAGRLCAAVACLCLFLPGLRLVAATCTWTNAVGGTWNNPSNWQPNQVPAPGDTVVITAPGNYAVTLDVNASLAGLLLGTDVGGSTQSLHTAGWNLTVNGQMQVSAQGHFNLDGGALGGTNDLSGVLTWSGGSLAGAMTIASNSVLNIVAGGGDGFDGLVLTNYGTINWSNTPLYGINGHNAQVYNYGLWNAQSDNQFYGAYNGGARSLFDNFGTLTKSGGANASATVFDGNVVFNNWGVVQGQVGNLGLHGGGTVYGGNFDTTGGGVVNLYGQLLTNTVSFSGAGAYVVGGASFAGVVVGPLSWAGGSLSGSLSLPTNGILNIVGGGGDGFDGLALTNYGTVNWTNTPLYGINGHNAQIYNYGLWNAQSDNQFYGGYNGGTSVFNNWGTFLKSSNYGTTTLNSGVVFNNLGIISVQSGMLNVNNGSADGGRFDTAAGTGVNLANYVLTNLVTFNGPGGALTGNATLAGTVAGVLAWNGGSLAGGLTVASNGVFTIATGGNGILQGLALTNYGTVNWTNTTLYGESGQNAQIYNYGFWNVQSDDTFYGGWNGGASLFNNYGTFIKSGHSGTTTLDGRVVFNNTGTVNVQNGTLSINGGGVNSGVGRFNTATGAFLDLSGITFANSAQIGGADVVDLGGNTTINGVLTAADLQLVGGELSGTNTLVGTLTWSGGNLAGAMTIASNSVLNIVAGGGDGFDGLVLTNYGTINWSNTPLYGINGHNAQVYNYGLWNAQSDNQFYGGYNGGARSLFDNFGTLTKSGGANASATVFDGNVVFNNWGVVQGQVATWGCMVAARSMGGILTPRAAAW